VTNNLGAVAALRGDPTTAANIYESARALAGNSAELSADLKAIEENLRRLAVVR
jgi:Flp pilus assembly protein TadD